MPEPRASEAEKTTIHVKLAIGYLLVVEPKVGEKLEDYIKRASREVEKLAEKKEKVSVG